MFLISFSGLSTGSRLIRLSLQFSLLYSGLVALKGSTFTSNFIISYKKQEAVVSTNSADVLPMMVYAYLYAPRSIVKM